MHDGPLGAAHVGIVAGPHTRQKRRGELAAGDESDDERAEAQALMHVQRNHRNGDANDQEDCDDDGDDRQQRRDDRSCRGRR